MTNVKIQMTNESGKDKLLNVFYWAFKDLFGFCHWDFGFISAAVVELADTHDLGSCAERLGGSTPLRGMY